MDLRPLLARHGDLAVAVVAAALHAAEMAAFDPTRPALAVPLAAAVGMALVLRRRLPLVSFVAVMATGALLLATAPEFGDGSAMFVLTFAFSLYSLGRHARGTEAWLGTVGVVVMVAVFVIGDGSHELGDITFAVAFVGSPWVAGLALRLRAERDEFHQRRAVELEREADEEARRAVAEERTRIARELHDVVSHAIAVTVLQARGSRRLVGEDDEAVRRALDAIEQTNTAALGDMRRMLAVLRDRDDAAPTTTGDAVAVRVDDGPTANGTPRPAPQPGLADLDRLVGQVRSSGLRVELERTGDGGPVPPGVDLSAYRIVQEALTNVIKHAGPAATARVHVDHARDAVTVSVSDDGAGPGTDGDTVGRAAGHGLAGIRERVAVVGGSIETGPVEAGGFQVRARLPLSLDADEVLS